MPYGSYLLAISLIWRLFSNELLCTPLNYVIAHNLRGEAYGKKSKYNRAIEDFNTAIALNPNYFIAYYNRGLIWLRLRANEKARDNLTNARDMGMNIAAVFHKEYGSVDAFGEEYGIEIPADIAEMLAPDPPE